MGRIITPNGSQAVSFDNVTKTQLAQQVNRQNRELESLHAQKRKVIDLLLTIVQEPEALTVVEAGKVTIDRFATLKVKDQTTLHVLRVGDLYELTSTAPQDKPVIEMSRIVMPGGVVN